MTKNLTVEMIYNRNINTLRDETHSESYRSEAWVWINLQLTKLPSAWSYGEINHVVW